MSTPFNYYIEQQAEQYLTLSAQGSAGKKEILSMYQEACELGLKQNCFNLMVDVKQVTLDFPMTDFVPIMNELTDMLATFKIARLCNTFEFRQDLIENVSGKANLNLKNFSEDEEALAWLLS